MSDLKLNTIAGTVIGAALLSLVLRTGAETIFHPHFPKTPGFSVPIDEGGGATAEAEAPKGPPDFGRLFADEAQLTALIAQGDKVHKVCVSCHTDEKGGGNKTGPELWNVFGRQAASLPGFNYSAAMQAYGKQWSYVNLYDYLAAPGKYVPGTTMSFAGVRKSEDRVALVAYLRSINDNPNAPLPEPLPEAPAIEAAETDGETPGGAPPPVTDTAPAPPTEPASVPQSGTSKAG
jgi:cytochrome c